MIERTKNGSESPANLKWCEGFPGNLGKIWTWNVRSLYPVSRLWNLILEMNRLNINILGISEVSWPGNGKLTTDYGILYFSASDNLQGHQNEFARLVDNNTDINFVRLSDRVMMLQSQTPKVRINILQVYAPTSESKISKIEEFF